MHNDFIVELENLKNSVWEEISKLPFWEHILNNEVDIDLYISICSQIYHYIQHTPKSQAIAGTKVNSDQLKLLRFCYQHSLEEAGHELMIINDMKKINIDTNIIVNSSVLPETQKFIDKIYDVSENLGAIPRLGLSYWIEGSYNNFDPILQKVIADLHLQPGEITFFVEHAQLDKHHLAKVIKIINEYAVDKTHQDLIKDVLKTTLMMFGDILNSAFNSYVINKKEEVVA